MKSQSYYSCAILLVVVGIIFLSKYPPVTTEKYDNHVIKKCEQLLRQVKHWYFTAQQDKDPFLGLLHAHTAVIKFNTLCLVMNTSDINRLLKVNAYTLSHTIKGLENSMLERFAKHYPQVTVEGVLTSDHEWYV